MQLVEVKMMLDRLLLNSTLCDLLVREQPP